MKGIVDKEIKSIVVERSDGTRFEVSRDNIKINGAGQGTRVGFIVDLELYGDDLGEFLGIYRPS